MPITLTVNNEPLQLSGDTVSDLIKANGLHGQPGFAVAVNEQVVPKTSWEQYPLKEGDTVLIINPTQGG